jgi:hypothetical protein
MSPRPPSPLPPAYKPLTPSGLEHGSEDSSNPRENGTDPFTYTLTRQKQYDPFTYTIPSQSSHLKPPTYYSKDTYRERTSDKKEWSQCQIILGIVVGVHVIIAIVVVVLRMKAAGR